jgi:hypothetical protein
MRKQFLSLFATIFLFLAKFIVKAHKPIFFSDILNDDDYKITGNSKNSFTRNSALCYNEKRCEKSFSSSLFFSCKMIPEKNTETKSLISFIPAGIQFKTEFIGGLFNVEK